MSFNKLPEFCFSQMSISFIDGFSHSSELKISESLDDPSEKEFSINLILILLFAQIFFIIFIGFAWILDVLRYSDEAFKEKLDDIKHLTSKNNVGSSYPSSTKPKESEFTV